MKTLILMFMSVFAMGTFAAEKDLRAVAAHYLQIQTAQKASYAARKAEVEDDYCANAMTTPSINFCIGLDVSTAEIELSQYLLASINKLEDYPDMAESIHASQQAWLIYRKEACSAVYQMWIDGSIRSAMHAGCQLSLTQERTHYVWETYLTYMDSATPDLPEPDSK